MTMPHHLLPILLLPLLASATLVAQKMPLPNDSGRILQVFDLDRFGQRPKQFAPPKLGLQQDAADDHDDPQRLVGLFRHLIDPPLQADDDLSLLGNRWLVVLGSPVQVASAERLWQAALAQKDTLIDVQVQLFEVAVPAFAPLQKQLVAVQRDGGAAFEGMLEREAAATFRAALANAAKAPLLTPRLSMRPLQRGNLAMLTQTSYVKDFTLVRQGDTLVADPIVGVVHDGSTTDVIATWLPDGMLGLSCHVTIEELQKPIPQFETTLAKDLPPVTIQLPRVTGVRLQQTAVLGKDSMVVLAAQRADGTWLCATVRAAAMPR